MMAKHKKFLEQDPEGWRKCERERMVLCGFHGKELEGRVEKAVMGRGDRVWCRIVLEMSLIEGKRMGMETEMKMDGEGEDERER